MRTETLALLIGLTLFGTAVYNLVRDRHVRQEFKARGIPTWLRFGAVLAEFITAALLIIPLDKGVGLWLALGLLLSSIGVCLGTQWYRRLYLSVPLLGLVGWCLLNL